MTNDSARADFEKLRNTVGRVDPRELDALWPRLPVVRVEEILGLWRGTPLETGHKRLGYLREISWFGKHFVAPMDAKPLICHAADGSLRSEPADGGEASLWMAEYRGELTATMVYDRMPLLDHFKAAGPDTLLGVMNGKDTDFVSDDGHRLYFILDRA
ncbi:DUF4334 domain-containing protein [Actinokineospora iranica]|uniref:DUF4334 domain-containing protein n=1 Tax=Actinokineospora iranica TaxID=1271860 RepID=UPI001E5FED3F|nr:DUF4334 domain-containing protein [Actinokineospora iranica]